MVPVEAKTAAFGFFAGAALFGGALSPSAAGLVMRFYFFGIYWIVCSFLAFILFLLGLLDLREVREHLNVHEMKLLWSMKKGMPRK